MEHRNVKWAKGLVFLLSVAIAGSFLCDASGAGSEARRILQAAGRRGGLAVHVGCKDGRLAALLRSDGKYVVQGLHTEREVVRNARQHIRSEGLYGPVSVEGWDGKDLPYVDNLVNLLVVEEKGELTQGEMMRVLAPGGMAFVRLSGEWVKKVKPVPADTDEWTHFLHGPDNNAVARDERVSYPEHLQWLALPRWTRDHDTTPSIFGVVSAGGRIFYVQDEGPISVFDDRLPGRHVLIARDAYNGVELWRRRIPSWYPGRMIWGTVPVHLHRRMVATRERLFVTDGLGGPVVALDAKTGDELRTYDRTERAAELLVDDGVLVVGRMKTEPRKQDPVPTKRQQAFRRTGFRADPRRGEQLVALDASTGNELWRHASAFVPLCLCIDNGKVFTATDESVTCRNLSSGEIRWSVEQQADALVAHGDTLLAVGSRKPPNPEPIRLRALSQADGSVRWERRGRSMPTFPLFYIPPQVFVARGLAWLRSQDGRSMVGVSIETGQTRQEISSEGAFTPGHHVRCYPAKATERLILTGKRGIEFHDLTAGQPSVKCDWIRGMCRLGVVPCNGMIYLPPHGCNCSVEVGMKGFRAVGSESALPAETSDNRLYEGPAYGDVWTVENTVKTNRGEWPAYRRDTLRSCSTKTEVPSGLTEQWRISFSGELTSPVFARGRLFVAEKDAHAVHALSAESGERLWSFTAGGPVDSAPTVAGGRVVFGCTDGRVYCLRARDGALVWRFRAAPAERRIVSHERVESCWPAHGSVPVVNGIVYASAGRSSYLDGGIFLYGLDLEDGTVRCRNRVFIDRQKQDTDTDYTFNTPGLLSDILVSDGTHIYMRHVKFDLELNCVSDLFPMTDDDTSDRPRAVATAGFLDDSNYSRVFRACSTSWTGRYSARRAQQVAFRQNTVYGARVFHGRGWKSPRYHIGEGSILFAQDREVVEKRLRDVSVFSLHGNRGGGRGWDFTIPRDTYEWQTQVPCVIRAMVETPGKLIVGGSADRFDPDDPYAMFEGRSAGMLLMVSSEDGKKLSTHPLPAPPVMDGVAVGEDVYVSTAGGHLLCLAARDGS